MNKRIVKYYTDEYVELDRLQRSAAGRLEFIRTQELLREYLPASPATIADIGGGTGAHAAWLRHDGYDVILLDLVPAHAASARREVADMKTVVADAREVPLEAASADAALLLGPLYHLQVGEDRARALAEATRITRPGGLVAAAAISRYAPILDVASAGRFEGELVDLIREQLATGRHDPRVGFTEAYMHLPKDLAAELATARLVDVHVHGIEGPLWPTSHLLEADADLSQYARLAEELDENPDAVALSCHFLGVGRIPMEGAVGG